MSRPESGSHQTLCWRGVDSNPRSPRKREFSGSGSRPGARCRLPALDDAHRGEPGAARRGTKPIGRQRRGAGDWRAPEPIAAMIEACRSGPIGAHVTEGRTASSQDDGSLGSIQWLRFRAARNSASTVKAGLELEHNLFRNADPQTGPLDRCRSHGPMHACRLHLTCFYHTPRAERHRVLCYSAP